MSQQDVDDIIQKDDCDNGEQQKEKIIEHVDEPERYKIPNRHSYASQLHHPRSERDVSMKSGMIISKSLCIGSERRPKAPQRKKVVNVISAIKEDHGNSVSVEMKESENGDLNLVVRGRSGQVDSAIDNILTQLTIPDRLTIPEYVPMGLLKLHGETFKDLENSLECRITVSTQNKIVNIFSSSQASADTASKSLSDFFVKLQNVTIETLVIPKIYHPWIRGPFSRTIDNIRSETETDINMPILQNSQVDISVSGSLQNVTRACACIHQTYKNQLTSLTAASFDLPRTQQKILRENNYNNVDKILDKTNVAVELPLSPLGSTHVILRGTSNSAIGEALSMISTLTSSTSEETVEVPLILNNIMRSKLNIVRNNMSSVSIDIVKNMIIIRGTPGNVHRTRDYLQDIINQMMKCITVETLDLDKEGQTIITRGFRQKYNQYFAQNNVIMTKSNDGSKIHFEGQSEHIEIVKKDIYNYIERTKNETIKSIKVDREFHGKIIGAKGSKITEIKSLFDVNISVPTAEEKKDEIIIRGPLDDVERCVYYINDFVDDLRQSDHVEEISVPKSFHKMVIGHKGNKIQEIRQASNAVIGIPLPADPSCIIRLRGSPKEVNIAKEHILSIVNSRAEENISIPSKVQFILMSRNNLAMHLRKGCGNVQIIRHPNGKVGEFIIRGDRMDVNNAVDFLHSEIDKALEHYITQEIELSFLQKSFIQNNCNDFMTDLAHQYDVSIVNNVENDDGNAVFQFGGTKENVSLAVALFNDKLGKIGDIVERNVKIPSEFHSRFLRRDGTLLENLRESFAVEIIVPSNRSSNENFIVRGNEDSIQDAENKIFELVKSWEDEVTVKVPCDYVPFLRSNMRSIVNVIEYECNVQIKILNAEKVEHGTMHEMLDGIEPDYILIIGKSENCEMAAEHVKERAPTEIRLDIPRQYHSRIIGRQGIEISRIKRESGINEIIVPQRSNSDECSPVILRGTSTAVEKAKEFITELVNSASNQLRGNMFGTRTEDPNHVTISVDVPKNLHPRIIGKGGKTINRLRQEFHVEISVPAVGSDQYDTIIRITGLPDDCDQAKEQIEAIREESFQTGDNDQRREPYNGGSRFSTRFNNRPHAAVSKQAIIDANSVPRLIGSKGRAINSFRDQYKVDVRFNSDENNPDVVIISGNTDELVDDAIEALILLSTDNGFEDREGERMSEHHGNRYFTSHQDYENGERIPHRRNQPPPDTSDLTEFPGI